MTGNQFQTWLLSWLEQCLMRRAPQDDGPSYEAMLWAVFAYGVVDLLQAAVSVNRPQAFAIAISDTALMMAFGWLVLKLVGKPQRFVQTLTALAGTRALLGLLGVPLVIQAGRVESGGGSSALLVSAWLALLIWNVTVQANIFRHALSVRYGIGVLVAILYTVLAIALMQYFFPLPAD